MPNFKQLLIFRNWTDDHQVKSGDVLDEEEIRRKKRREALKEAGVDVDWPVAGLALSGGGIRSATFSLGLLRELAAQRLLHRFDYLSTVSGGSYIGAYYAALFAARGATTAPVLTAAEFADPNDKAGGIADPFEARTGAARASLEWLRQSGRYLAPSGSGDYWNALGLLVRNWIGLHLVIGATLMLFALLAVGFRMAMLGIVWPAYGPVPANLLLYAPLLVLLVFPAGVHIAYAWAYWITRRDSGGLSGVPSAAQVGTVIIAAVTILLTLRPDIALWCFPGATSAPAVAAGVAFFACVGFLLLILSRFLAQPAAGTEERWDARRNWLTRPMRVCAGAFVAILAAATIDGVSFWVYGAWTHGLSGALILPSVVAGIVVPAGRWLLARLTLLTGSAAPTKGGASGNDGKDATPAKPGLVTQELLLKAGAAIAAALLILLVFGFWTVLAYHATWPLLKAPWVLPADHCPLWQGRAIGGDLWQGCAPPPGGWGAIVMVWLSWTIILGFLFFFISRSPAFLNLSGLTSFYAGRLRRAYLGAGNRLRLGSETSRVPARKRALDQWEEHDDVLLSAYYAEKSAAPLHLINVTLNETRGTGSNLVQRDRRGRNLVIAPGGLYCDGDRDGELYRIKFDEDDQEKLPLSTWIAISGAAFSTGLGGRTGFPLTQLAGLANVRLGYWWRARSGLLSKLTQWDLLREFRGDFSGPTEKYWYLSDGGHFENTGAYELIRRKLPFIVVSDNGMDERFEYEDIANLVRKARIDFDCEIDFLDETALDDLFRKNDALRESFGTLVQIAGGGDPVAKRAVAALARLKYSNAPAGTLLLIKPRLTGDGPADLIRYKATNSSFPQQTTLDQFFDEAQWESYYHLGRLIGQSVFGAFGTAKVNPNVVASWSPASMSPIF